MKPDFSGYATRAGLRCSDGKTIMPDAFKPQDGQRVPLVWQHGHTDPENVLGHAILENRPEGVYAYCFLNNSQKATHSRELLEHGDIHMMSIWANQLIQRAGKVLHGVIREVSLVLAGANPGALIDSVTVRHSDGDEVLEDEAFIYTGEDIEIAHADTNVPVAPAAPAAPADTGETIADVYNTLNDKQKEVVNFMIGQALAGTTNNTAAQSATTGADDNEDTVAHGDTEEIENPAENGNTTQEGKQMPDTTIKHNVFEDKKDDDGQASHTLTHSELKNLVTLAATKKTSMKEVFEGYALEHGITDIETLFPDAKSITDVPEWDQRRTEWVATLMNAVRKSPFSRIRTTTADITMEEARAKGYIKGTLKKEEFFTVARRATTPTTIYKKQALDRDDVIDITDFDVVAWLKGEMRLMLDEEIARAILIGDGRDISDEDKINEQNIRPIVGDNEMYTSTIYVNVDDASSNMEEVVDEVIKQRAQLKGTGLPNFYTTEAWIARFMTSRDDLRRRLYRTLDELAAELRVAAVIPVEVLLETPDIVGIMVNPVDYVVGADKGGQVTMFDDFDIDYNKQKYLIETRISGALTKLKSAMVIRATAAGNALIAPAMPAFDPATGALTITNQTGVVYKHGTTTLNAAGSPYTVPNGQTWTVTATPTGANYFETGPVDWDFTNPA